MNTIARVRHKQRSTAIGRHHGGARPRSPGIVLSARGRMPGRGRFGIGRKQRLKRVNDVPYHDVERLIGIEVRSSEIGQCLRQRGKWGEVAEIADKDTAKRCPTHDSERRAAHTTARKAGGNQANPSSKYQAAE